MKFSFSEKFLKSYAAAPEQIRRAFDKQSRFLLLNIRHPSLHAKKYDESKDIWQARVNAGWRFYFTIENGVYCLQDIIKHPK